MPGAAFMRPIDGDGNVISSIEHYCYSRQSASKNVAWADIINVAL